MDKHVAHTETQREREREREIHYSKHICRVVYYLLCFLFPFPLFSSLFLTLHSMPHLPICFFLATKPLSFCLLFYSLIFNNINQSFCVDNVRATFDFGLFCVRSTTRKTFRPLPSSHISILLPLITMLIISPSLLI